MRVKNLIKHSLISILTLSFILINNISITFACGSPAMAEVYATLEKISGKMGMPPLHFVCLLYGDCYNDMNAIEKYANSIGRNLDSLREKIGNDEFNKFWNASISFEKETEEETEEQTEEQTIGEKFQGLLGLTRATSASEVVHEKGTGIVLDMYKKMLGSIGIPTEDEDGYNELREKLKELKEPLEKEVMPLMGRAQGEVFAKLDELDEGTKEHIKAIKEFHEAEIEEHKKASEVQALCKSRIDLVKENLSKLLGDIEKSLATLKLIAPDNPDNIEHSIEYIIGLSKIRQAIMNMSYITTPGYLNRSLDRRVQLRAIEPKGSVAEIIERQRQIGNLQTRISFLRDPIIQLISETTIVAKKEDIQEKESTPAKGGSKAKRAKIVDLAPYIPWQNSELATGISGKLLTYSLDPYHFPLSGTSAGMDKAYEIWTSLGYINEDAGVLEAKIRKTLVAPHTIHGHQNIKSDVYWGDAYISLLEIFGIDLKKQTILVTWEYKKIGETADSKIILSSYPKCVTIYQK